MDDLSKRYETNVDLTQIDGGIAVVSISEAVNRQIVSTSFLTGPAGRDGVDGIDGTDGLSDGPASGDLSQNYPNPIVVNAHFNPAGFQMTDSFGDIWNITIGTDGTLITSLFSEPGSGIPFGVLFGATLV